MSTIATGSDRILVQIAAGRAGEEEWRSLIERHGKAMRRAAKLATGSEALMDDAVQEALLQSCHAAPAASMPKKAMSRPM